MAHGHSTVTVTVAIWQAGNWPREMKRKLLPYCTTQGELRLGLPGWKPGLSAPCSLMPSKSTRLCEDPVCRQRWVCRNGYSITANRVLTCVSLYTSAVVITYQKMALTPRLEMMVQQLRDLSSVSSTHQVTHNCLQLQPQGMWHSLRASETPAHLCAYTHIDIHN